MKNKKKEILLLLFLLFGMFYLPSIFGLLLINVISDEYILSMVCNFLSVSLLIAVLNKYLIRDAKEFFKNPKKNIKISLKWWGIGLGIMYVANIIINLFIMKGSISANEELSRNMLINYPVFTLISACIFAPIVEELTFRFSLKPFFKSKFFYFLTSGILFGLAHALTDFTNPLQLLYIIPYGGLGYAFAVMYDKTNSIWSSILMHFIHNLITCLLLLAVL